MGHPSRERGIVAAVESGGETYFTPGRGIVAPVDSGGETDVRC